MLLWSRALLVSLALLTGTLDRATAKPSASVPKPIVPAKVPSLFSLLPLSFGKLRIALSGGRKKRILILISDTGGGHRASAQALAGLIEQHYGDQIDVSIVDVWTSYTGWPFNRMVRQYRYMQSRPALWYTMYKTSAFPPTRFFFNSAQRILAFSGIRACLEEHEPDLVISMHPLCQTVPLLALAALQRARHAEWTRKGRDATASTAGGRMSGLTFSSTSGAGSPQRQRGRIPFVTVVTDLGAAHPLWLHPGVDLCFVPSKSFVRAAKIKGLRDSQLRLHGLPVRQDFTLQKRRGAGARRELGLIPDRKTVLIVGGGDGVGKLGAIVQAIGERLGESAQPMQMVVVCGRNQRLQRQLRDQEWPSSLHVQVEGFVSRMSEFMAAADCIVTKAGPGTIAEASICGLPVMLSGHLPGQETGNVKHVLANGFGAYSRNPRIIAKTVAAWLDDPQLLETLSANARAAARPGATLQIVRDVVGLLFQNEEDSVLEAQRRGSVLPVLRGDCRKDSGSMLCNPDVVAV